MVYLYHRYDNAHNGGKCNEIIFFSAIVSYYLVTWPTYAIINTKYYTYLKASVRIELTIVGMAYIATFLNCAVQQSPWVCVLRIITSMEITVVIKLVIETMIYL